MRAIGLLLLLIGVAGCDTVSGQTQRPSVPSPSPHPVAPNGADPRGPAFLRLSESLQGRVGNLPGGCATLARERVCVPRVLMDGQRLPDLAVLDGVVGVAASPTGPRLPLESPRAMHQGIAIAIFHRLLQIEGQREGTRVTEAQALALARQELKLYQQSRRQGRQSRAISIPPGMTPRQYFLSPRSVEAYRLGLIAGHERQRILQRYRSLPPGRAFRLWFRATLKRHTVTINGSSPAFSLPDNLPANV